MPQDADRAAVNVIVGAMTKDNTVTVEIFEAKDASGTSAKAVPIGLGEVEYVYTSPGTPATVEEVTAIFGVTLPADGQSLGLSTCSSAGAEKKYVIPFNLNGGYTALTTPIVGYTAVVPITSDDIATPSALKDYFLANFGDEVSVTLTGSEFTFTNKYPGAVTAPNANDSGMTVSVNQAGTDLSTSEPQPPAIVLDFSLRYLDRAHGFNYFTAKVTTVGTILVAAQAIIYETKHDRSTLPAGQMW
jgi:hypothetical protein